MNVEASRKIALAAVARGVKKLVFLSSIKVNGEFTTDQPFDRRSPCLPKTPYAESKYRAEQVLHEVVDGTKTSLVILRLPLVYGGMPRHNLMKLIGLVDKGIPLPFARIENRRHMLALSDLLQLIKELLLRPEVDSGTWAVADAEPWSTIEMTRVIGSALGVKPWLVSVPPVLLVRFLAALGKGDSIRSMTANLEIDATEVRQRFGLGSGLSRSEILAASVSHYKNN